MQSNRLNVLNLEKKRNLYNLCFLLYVTPFYISPLDFPFLDIKLATEFLLVTKLEMEKRTIIIIIAVIAGLGLVGGGVGIGICMKNRKNEDGKGDKKSTKKGDANKSDTKATTEAKKGDAGKAEPPKAAAVDAASATAATEK